jgi:hypothetical protein
MFNTESEKDILTKSLRGTGDVKAAVNSLEFVIENHTPFALYIATADRSLCTWVFDPDTIYDMLGGKDIHDKTFRKIFTSGLEREQGVLFYILNKIGPVTTIRLSISSLREVLDQLTTSA